MLLLRWKLIPLHPHNPRSFVNRPTSFSDKVHLNLLKANKEKILLPGASLPIRAFKRHQRPKETRQVKRQGE